MSDRYIMLGISDDVNECWCCGKPQLKRTVALQWTTDGESSGEVVYFGTTCAARAIRQRTGQRVSARQVESAAAAADEIRRGEIAARAMCAADDLAAPDVEPCALDTPKPWESGRAWRCGDALVAEPSLAPGDMTAAAIQEWRDHRAVELAAQSGLDVRTITALRLAVRRGRDATNRAV